MPDYVFIDGPLVGQTTSLTTEGPGDSLVVEVVDYDDDPALVPGLTYVVDSSPSLGDAGQLRFMSSVSLDRTGTAGPST